MLKYRLCSLEKPEDEMVRSPVLASEVAPVAVWYFARASEAMRSRVVPGGHVEQLD